MDRFLGLRFVRKPLTDVEYVERVRKDMLRFKRWGKWIVVFSAAGVLFWGYILTLLVSAFVQLGGNGNLFIMGLFAGLLIGMLFALPAWYAMEQFLQALKMLREDRMQELLVKYHDMLIEMARQEDEPEE